MLRNNRKDMLCYLSIKNIVLIEKLELDFKEGFTVLTGETGAGKSIIVDAVSLILGKRSERRLIRKGQDSANVSAMFRLPHNHIAKNFANENGFIIKEEVILRRQILSNGRSQCFLNDEAISLSLMKQISNLLIEVHGQNDQAGLLDSINHVHINKIDYFIQGEDDKKGIYENLSLAKKQVSTIISLNIEKFKGLDEAIDRTIIELKEVEISLGDCLNSADETNLSIDDIEKRISFIRQVSRKHNVEINDLKEVKNKLEIQLSNLSNNKADLKILDNENKVLKEKYVSESKTLSNLRGLASKKLSQAVNKEFPILKLDNAFFKISIELIEENHWNSNGIDNVVFQIETNKGSGLESIDKIASGGELSRIMLAIKVSLSSDDNNYSNKKTLIFDEVDTGVGGAVADAIGKRLFLLGANNQVLAVTHHPQVAARSSHHFKVNKSTNNSFTTTSINNLEVKERIEEVARMLSGEKITDAARNAAESLFLNNKNL